MKKRPILFSSEMVRAILEGRKTQTRRVVKPPTLRLLPKDPKLYMQYDFGRARVDHGSETNLWCQDNNTEYLHVPCWRPDEPKFQMEQRVFCPYGQVGDRLWVRETHHVLNAGNKDGSGIEVVYRADDPDFPYGWKPSIFMPRWASRINLEITGIRCERLQDITPDDCLAEGMRYQGEDTAFETLCEVVSLWDSINGKKHPWDSNPWVWVVEFKKI